MRERGERGSVGKPHRLQVVWRSIKISVRPPFRRIVTAFHDSGRKRGRVASPLAVEGSRYLPTANHLPGVSIFPSLKSA